MADEVARKDSDAYWDSDNWDPDSRIYVGCDGDSCHKYATLPEEKQARFSRQVSAVSQASGASHEAPAVSPKEVEVPTAVAEAKGSPEDDKAEVAPAIHRVDSAAYWGADTWDPEDRVYAGTDSRLAVQPEEPDQFSRQVSAASTEEARRSTFAVEASTVVESMDVPRRNDSAAYWGASAALDGHALQQQQDVSEAAQEQTHGSHIHRTNSDEYWDAEQWDPDQRVYVGAAGGDTSHLAAVLEKASEHVLRVWVGGLSSTSMSLGGELGSPVPLAPEDPGGKPFTLKDLYEIETSAVGSGSFAEVRLGRHLASQTDCAVKILDKLRAGEDFKKQVDHGMFSRRLHMTKEVPHSNVVKYFDFLEGPNNFYVVMERLEGAELMEQVEADFPLTEDYCRNIMSQVLSSLKHIHDMVGVYHRDVKLGNFRFRSKGIDTGLVLFDFQFAGKLDAAWDGKVCGTKMFMAPEVLSGTAQQPHLASIDIWSAGVILYVLLTGDSPVQEEELPLLKGPIAAVQALLDKAMLTSELSKVSAEVTDLLRRLLLLDPAARISASAALEHPWFSGTTGATLAPSKAAYLRARSFSEMR